MICIILAAGYATRLYPLTKNFPKPLLKVANKPILNHLIDDLSSGEIIDEYVVVSNHKFAPIFKEWTKQLPQKITIVDDGTESNETRLGAVKDLQLAVKQLDTSQDCLVMAGDNLLDFSLLNFIEFAKQKDASCVMHYDLGQNADASKYGILELKGDRIVSMAEKPTHPRSNHACPPFYYYKYQDLMEIDEALADDCAYDAPGSFAVWLCQHSPMYAYRMPGQRYDIGNIESYERVKEIFSQTSR